MKTGYLLRKLLISICLQLSALSLAFAEVNTSETGIEYISGGIGDGEESAETVSAFNLKLVFATQGSGEFLADIKVSIEDSKGKNVLTAISSGPHFYAKLPAGSYRITAEFAEKPLKKVVSIKNKNGRQVLYFYWPEKT